MVDRSPTADEQLARHLATAKRQMQERGQTRDEMGRITKRLPSPLADWEEPKRETGEAMHRWRGRDQIVCIRVPIRAYAELKNLAEQRGVTLTYILHEAIENKLQPVLQASLPALTDAPIPFRQPNRIHSAEPPQVKRRGYLTDRR